MPPLDILQNLTIERRRGSPKHTQVEQSLHTIIERHFADGDLFYTDAQLVERLGVSRPTVRQALAELTRKGLLRRRPSIGTTVIRAQPTVARGNARHAGMVLAEYDSEYMSMLLQQLLIECRRRGFELHTYYTHQGEGAEQATQQILRPPEEERIIVMGSLPVLQWLVKRGYRVVSLETITREHDYPVVETDARVAAQIGVDYLHSLGHRRITLLVNEPATIISVQDKIEQFRVSEPLGRVVICGTQVWDNSYQAAYAHMGEVWGVAPSERPTAIMTTSDPGAWAALRWLTERDIRVPGDVSVLGFEDARSSRFMHPSLSSIAHPIEALARTALETLWEEPGDTPQHRLTPTLMIRESTGPAVDA